jgi:thymidine kinase
MDLQVVLGPMKSGKTLELVSQIAPLRYATIGYQVYQSDRHGRDAGVVSRTGASLPTVRTRALTPLLTAGPVEVVGIDEIHMFTPDDVAVLGTLLERGVRIVVTGIDTDHRGELFPTVQALLELGPAAVMYRRAVCDQCRDFSAIYTQVLADGVPFTAPLGGQPLPDDGTLGYEARCRRCFVRP